MSICPWCGAEFPAFTNRNGTPKIFCDRKGRPCSKDFNRRAYRLGRDYLYRLAELSDLPLKEAEIPTIPTPGGPASGTSATPPHRQP